MDNKNCSLYLKGIGHSFQYLRLNQDDARTLKSLQTSDAENFILGMDGPEVPEEQQLCEYVYGIDVSDFSLRWEDDTDENNPNTEDANLICESVITDEETPKSVLDFVEVKTGKVFGNIHLPISDPSEFDVAKLDIYYFEYRLDGYAEEYGKMITRIEYNGEDIELDFEDNGLETSQYLLGYEYEKDEFIDHAVIYEMRSDELITDYQWDKLDLVFP